MSGRRLILAAALSAAALAGCNKSPSGPSQNTEAAAGEQGPAAPVVSPEEMKKLVATLPAPFNTGDLDNGQAKFALCAACHTLTPGGSDMTGPNLNGVFGRQAATKPGYAFSDDAKKLNFKWDAQHLDAWLTNPKNLAPNTKMSFPGFPDPKDRIDVIAYLKAETSPTP